MQSPLTLHPGHEGHVTDRGPLTLVLFENPTWLVSVKSKLEQLTALPTGWDAMGSPPVRNDIAEFALNHLLPKILKDQTPAPSLVPISGGGLQIEWHQNNVDIELFVSGRFDTEFYFRDVETEETFETALVADFSILETYINRLT